MAQGLHVVEIWMICKLIIVTVESMNQGEQPKTLSCLGHVSYISTGISNHTNKYLFLSLPAHLSMRSPMVLLPLLLSVRGVPLELLCMSSSPISDAMLELGSNAEGSDTRRLSALLDEEDFPESCRLMRRFTWRRRKSLLEEAPCWSSWQERERGTKFHRKFPILQLLYYNNTEETPPKKSFRLEYAY